MGRKVIPWVQGEGNIIASFTGEGSGSVSFSSDVENEDTDRSQEITLRNTSGSPSIIRKIMVRQPGAREPLAASDGDFFLPGTGSETFNVLKGGTSSYRSAYSGEKIESLLDKVDGFINT